MPSTPRPVRPWRLSLPSPDGPIHKAFRSEATVRAAAEDEKSTTTADRIIVERWSAGVWNEWLRWVRKGHDWEAE